MTVFRIASLEINTTDSIVSCIDSINTDPKGRAQHSASLFPLAKHYRHFEHRAGFQTDNITMISILSTTS